MIGWQKTRRKDNKLIWSPDLVTRIPHSLIEMPIWQYMSSYLMAFKMTNAELLFEFLMKIYSSNFALIRKATVLNYPLPSHLIDIIQHKAFYIIIQQVTKTSQKAQRAQRLPDFTKKTASESQPNFSFKIVTKYQSQSLNHNSDSKYRSNFSLKMSTKFSHKI